MKAEIADIPMPASGDEETIRMGEAFGEADIDLFAKCFSAVDPEVLDFIIDGQTFQNHDVEKRFKQVVCPTLFLRENLASLVAPVPSP